MFFVMTCEFMLRVSVIKIRRKKKQKWSSVHLIYVHLTFFSCKQKGLLHFLCDHLEFYTLKMQRWKKNFRLFSSPLQNSLINFMLFFSFLFISVFLFTGLTSFEAFRFWRVVCECVVLSAFACALEPFTV